MSIRCLLLLQIWVILLSRNSLGYLSAERLLLGNLRFLGKGTIQSFIGTTDSGDPKSIGVLLSETILLDLPTSNQKIDLDLPKNLTLSPYNHISLIWYPRQSTFEIRFMMTAKTRCREPFCQNSLENSLENSLNDPEKIQLESSSSHLIGFSYTMHTGRLSSLNPWTRRELLQHDSQQSEEINLPLEIKITGFYPKSYSITYDRDLKKYRIALEDLEYLKIP